MLNSQDLYSTEDEDLFSISVPKSTFIPNGAVNDGTDSNKNIPLVLLSPILASKCGKDKDAHMSNVDNIAKLQDDEWMFSLDDSIVLSAQKPLESKGNATTNIFLNNTEESCYNYYNMAQQNYQLWLSSF